MPTYENSSNINPIDLGEMRDGEYVLSKELRSMISSAHSMLYSKSNIIAYSYCAPVRDAAAKFALELTDEEGEDIFWVFTVRRKIPQKNLTLHIWGEFLDYYLDIQDSMTNVWTEVGDASTGTASRQFITYAGTNDSDADGADHLHRLRFRVRVAANHPTLKGKGYGFVMIEENLSASITTEVSGTTTKVVSEITGIPNWRNLDATTANDNETFNVFKFRALMRNIDSLARYVTRGCAVAYPRHYRPAMSSVYWRADGPYQWKASPWCSSVSVIVDGDNNGYTDWTAQTVHVGAISSAVKEDVRTPDAVRDISQVQNIPITNNSMNFRDNVIEVPNVKVRAGENNEIFVVFKGSRFSNVADPKGASWESRNEGILTATYNDTGGPTGFERFFAHPAGSHFLVRYYDSTSYAAGIPDPGDGSSHPGPGVSGLIPTEDAAYSSMPGEDEYPDTYGIYDLVNFRSSDGSGVGSFGVSPSPRFITNDVPEAGLNARLCKHGWFYLNSVWIDEEYGGEPDLYKYATHFLPPQASLNFVGLRLLNNMLDHAWQVNGLRHVSASKFVDYFGESNSVAGASAESRYKISNGMQYFILRNHQEQYKNTTNPVYTSVASFPITLPLDSSQAVGVGPRRVYDKVRFRVHYRLFKMNEGSDGSEADDENPRETTDEARIKLSAKASCTDYPPGGNSASSDAPYITDPLEVAVSDKAQSHLTVQTFTEWDAMAAASKCGFTRTAGDGAHFMSTNQHAWPAEIIGEKYPWDVFEFEADLGPLLYGEYDGGDTYGPRPVYQYPTWISLLLALYSYKEDGSGTAAGSSQGGDKYHMVISGISCVPSNYPLEDTVEEL